MAEGFLEIIDMVIYNDTTGMFYEYSPGGPFGDWVPFNPEAVEMNSMRIHIYFKNTGDWDSFLWEARDQYNNLLGFEETGILPAGYSFEREFLFEMPNENIIVTINTNHWVSGPVSP